MFSHHHHRQGGTGMRLLDQAWEDQRASAHTIPRGAQAPSPSPPRSRLSPTTPIPNHQTATERLRYRCMPCPLCCLPPPRGLCCMGLAAATKGSGPASCVVAVLLQLLTSGTWPAARYSGSTSEADACGQAVSGRRQTSAVRPSSPTIAAPGKDVCGRPPNSADRPPQGRQPVSPSHFNPLFNLT